MLADQPEQLRKTFSNKRQASTMVLAPQAKIYITLLATTFVCFSGCYPKTPTIKEQAKSETEQAKSEVDETKRPAVKIVSDEDYFRAAALGDLAEVQRAVRQGIPVDSLDIEGRTALMLAAYEGHSTVVESLLKSGATVDLPGPFNRTALMLAASGTSAETVEVLLKAGANVNAKDSHENWTPLMIAAAEGHMDVVRAILDRNPDLEFREVDGENAYDFAVQGKHADVAELIKSRMKAKN
jgi:uncharacterized protein